MALFRHLKAYFSGGTKVQDKFQTYPRAFEDLPEAIQEELSKLPERDKAEYLYTDLSNTNQ